MRSIGSSTLASIIVFFARATTRRLCFLPAGRLLPSSEAPRPKRGRGAGYRALRPGPKSKFMGIKKRVKVLGLQLCRGLGLFYLVRESSWRSRRLLILAYHGFSLLDEHLWYPELFLSAGEFELRLAFLAAGGYKGLPLTPALPKLYEGTLPEKGVVITIDDGNYDFYVKAFPLLQTCGFPATVYLTTYYCDYGLPLFNHICSYMLWKCRGRVIPASGLTDSISELDLRRPETRLGAYQSLLLFAEQKQLSVTGQDELARRLAGALSLAYDELVRLRLLQRMNPAEVASIASPAT